MSGMSLEIRVKGYPTTAGSLTRTHSYLEWERSGDRQRMDKEAVGRRFKTTTSQRGRGSVGCTHPRITPGGHPRQEFPWSVIRFWG